MVVVTMPPPADSRRGSRPEPTPSNTSTDLDDRRRHATAVDVELARLRHNRVSVLVLLSLKPTGDVGDFLLDFLLDLNQQIDDIVELRGEERF